MPRKIGRDVGDSGVRSTSRAGIIIGAIRKAGPLPRAEILFWGCVMGAAGRLQALSRTWVLGASIAALVATSTRPRASATGASSRLHRPRRGRRRNAPGPTPSRSRLRLRTRFLDRAPDAREQSPTVSGRPLTGQRPRRPLERRRRSWTRVAAGTPASPERTPALNESDGNVVLFGSRV